MSTETLDEIVERYHYMPQPPWEGFPSADGSAYDAWVLASEVVRLRYELEGMKTANGLLNHTLEEVSYPRNNLMAAFVQTQKEGAA